MYRFAMVALGAALALSMVSTEGASAQGYQTLPAGSYQGSCTNMRLRGNTLVASCTNTSGQRVRSSLDVSTCTGADIGNVNGQLACVRNGSYYGRGRGTRGTGRAGRYGQRYTAGLPAGSYQASCTNAQISGSTLSAVCRTFSGQGLSSYLDISQCRPNDDIGNVNGQLRCVYRGY